MNEVSTPMPQVVLETIRREADRIVSDVGVSRPVPVYTTTIDRLVASGSLDGAAGRVGWASLVVVAESAIATVEVEEIDGSLDASIALGEVPQAVSDALQLLEEELDERPGIGEIAVLKIGQLAVLAIWLRLRGLIVPVSLGSELRGLDAKRVYDEQTFVSAVIGIGERLPA